MFSTLKRLSLYLINYMFGPYHINVQKQRQRTRYEDFFYFTNLFSFDIHIILLSLFRLFILDFFIINMLWRSIILFNIIANIIFYVVTYTGYNKILNGTSCHADCIDFSIGMCFFLSRYSLMNLFPIRRMYIQSIVIQFYQYNILQMFKTLYDATRCSFRSTSLMRTIDKHCMNALMDVVPCLNRDVIGMILDYQINNRDYILSREHANECQIMNNYDLSCAFIHHDCFNRKTTQIVLEYASIYPFALDYEIHLMLVLD